MTRDHTTASTDPRRRPLRLLVFTAFGLSSFVGAAILGGSAVRAAEAAAQQATGIVFHDRNENQKFDADDQPLKDIRVSNGRQIVRTDEQGRYKLPVDDDTILFVIKPRNWRTPISEAQLPRFYYIHKPKGSSAHLKFPGVPPTGPLPESVDFPLYPVKEPDQFKAILFGDPQPRNQTEVDYIGHDVIEELVGTDASFGVTLGDIVFDDLSLFSSQAKAIALLGIPWYNVIGNHDINTDARDDRESDETFERAFGPAYYSFDHGPVHFLVLDNIEWVVDEETGKKRYVGGLGTEQLEFVKRDLELIPEEQLVVLLMHIPLVGTQDRDPLYRLIEKRPFCISVSGHTHHHEHRFITREDGWRGAEPHHHIINVTVSGSWWSGAPDENGIPHTTMADGAPNGYSIISFDGQKYKLDFKAARRPADTQMHIVAPDAVTADEAVDTDVYVNVYNGSSKSKVMMRVGSAEWRPMERVWEVDPLFQQTVDREKSLEQKPWRDLPKPKPSSHLWKARLPEQLPAGTHTIQIREVDMHGRVHHGRRILRVRAPAAETAGEEAKAAE